MSGYQRLVMDQNQNFLDFVIIKTALKAEYSKEHKSNYQKMISLNKEQEYQIKSSLYDKFGENI